MASNTVLAAGLGAALTALGWPNVHAHPPGHLAAAGIAGTWDRMVLIADAWGRLPDPRPALRGRDTRPVVVLGDRQALPALANALETRLAVAALDLDQPLALLVEALDRTLASHPAPDPGGPVAALRTREEEARRFTALTDRERHVLGALLHGRSASEIATDDVVSLATIRSHIRGVLVKVGASSQVDAVARAWRSCREPELVQQMRQVHQF